MWVDFLVGYLFVVGCNPPQPPSNDRRRHRPIIGLPVFGFMKKRGVWLVRSRVVSPKIAVDIRG
jgi:hypothetical protein